MDSSASGKSKGVTPNRPLTSRSSLSKSTKSGSPAPSPKVVTESPRPATSRGAGTISKPTVTKVGTAVKEANATKSSTVRTIAASPVKSKTVTHRDPASPIKPPAKQSARPQNGEKGAQQTASLLVTKNEAAKKTAEGAQLNKPKSGQEGGNTTPLKRNGTAKREVGTLPEHGSVPKDKTLCLRPESNTSVPLKPLATASSPTKSLKANSISHKLKQIVPPPEKPVNTTSLSAKAIKSPMASTRPAATTSTTPKLVKATSSLVKAPRSTPVSTKVAKTPTSPVKPVNTSSAPTKLRNATPAKPPANTTTNQVKLGKRLITTAKPTLASAKQVNTAPTAIKPIKSSPVAHKSVKEESVEATPVVNEVTHILSAESLQVINSEPGNVKMNTTEKMAELGRPLEEQKEPMIIAEEIGDVPVNNVIENTAVDDAKTGEELLKDSKLPLDRNESTSATEKVSAETHVQDKETHLLMSLTEEIKSPAHRVTPIEEEVSPSIIEGMSESSIASAEPLNEAQKHEIKALQETRRSPLEVTNSTMEATKPFEEQSNVPSGQEELRFPLELAISFAGPAKTLDEKLKLAKELNEEVTSLEHPVIDIEEGVYVPIKTLDEEVASSIKPSKGTVELLMDENKYLDEEQIDQSERMPMKPFDEETFTEECVEPLEEVVTSSLEQVTPLEEEVVLSQDELEPVEQKGIPLKEYSNSSKTLDHLEISPVYYRNPLELFTSSTEELTPSEEDMELFMGEKETLQEKISSSEPNNLSKPTEVTTCSIEPVINLEEEINPPGEPFEETAIHAEELKTSLEKEIPLNELLHSGEVVKCSEEGIISSFEVLPSSVKEFRLSQEKLILSVGTLQSLDKDVKYSQEEPMLLVEPLRTSVEEVKLSEEEPLSSVEPLQVSFEDVESSQEEPRLSVQSLHPSVEEVKSSQEEPMLSKEPLESSLKADRPSDGELTPSLLLLKSSLEPLNPLEETLLSSFNPVTETKSITSLEEPIRLEDSQSPVQLLEPSQHPKNVIEHFKLILKPVDYDAEIPGASIVESSGTVEQARQAANMDPEDIHETLPVESELFEEPLNIMHEFDHIAPQHVTAAENLLESASAEVEVHLDQSVHKSVLFPEEPLTSIEQSKTTYVEAADYPEKPIDSSLEPVKCSDYDEGTTNPSTHELMGYPEDLTTSPEKTFPVICKSVDPAVFTTSKEMDAFSLEPTDINNFASTLPNYQENFKKLESTMPFTSVDNVFVETSVELQLNEPSIHVLAPLDSLESVQEPIKYEVLMQPDEPERETNLQAPTTRETNYSLHYELNQPEEPMTSESLTSTENQNSTAELEPVTADQEKSQVKSSVDSDFYVTMDPTEQLRKLSTNQDIEEDIKGKKTPTTQVFYVSEEPILSTDEESLEPLDNTTYVLQKDKPTEILQQSIPVEGAKPSTDVSFSDESMCISHTEATSQEPAFSPARNTMSKLTTEQKVEVSKSTDLLMHPLQNVDPCVHPQEKERETWVVVKMEELSDFKEEPEERPLRPASLNQDAEVQDAQCKVEEELAERASVCSTLSDPQLAAKSSSETSTPEELRTYEDSSSGVESHSDDAATSPQTTLTPDPDLGIHMGQEEGTETPAGTPASNNKGVPPTLQIVDIEGQSQSIAPSGICDSSENIQIVRKKEMTASTESREHDFEERAKERGAQRVFPATFSR
ncbi:uncharacterized protein LOC142750031 isoform X2 [Rhinoderma darwinii]|uniref:uncharacterized protein LOC142750031 isoform X2 n=1 Tax=Rhinoderma darwinii TaxID=43563 RepID=UPI003F672509